MYIDNFPLQSATDFSINLNSRLNIKFNISI